jgi:hypothetical protein
VASSSIDNATNNGTVAAGDTVTVGFTGTYAGNDAAPAGVRCG